MGMGGVYLSIGIEKLIKLIFKILGIILLCAAIAALIYFSFKPKQTSAPIEAVIEPQNL